MLVDFDTEITDLKGQPIKAEPGGPENATLGMLAISALMAQEQGDNPSGTEKFKRFQLATKCNGKVDLKAEEVAMLKDRIGRIGTPLVVGRAWQLLDSAESTGSS